MANGDLVNFLKRNPKCNLDRLLYQIIQGVDYLHSQGVVHGDLKGKNVLIDENYNPRLADFGLTIFTEATMQTTSGFGGTLRWMAPELLSGQRRSPSSDIYAFACVCIEVYTGSVPFSDTRAEPQVIIQISQGTRPARPEKMTSDSLWRIVRHCWRTDKDARPKSRKVVSAFEQVVMKSRRNTGTPDGVEAYGRQADVLRGSTASFGTLEEPSLRRSNHTTRWLAQNVEDEYEHYLKRVKQHAAPHKVYSFFEDLQQDSSAGLFRVKGTETVVTVRRVDIRQPGSMKRLSHLIDEFQVTRFPHHPNIVNYVDLLQYENQIWIVMDSMKASMPLSKILERITQPGELKHSYLANVLRHVTQAVSYLHGYGIVHGNITSEHVLIGTGPGKNHAVRLKLGTMIDDSNSPSQKETLLAPEVRHGAPGPKTDIWNLGLLGIVMWDNHMDLNRDCGDVLLDLLRSPTPPAISMLRYFSDTLNVDPALRPTAEDLLQHPFLHDVGTTRVAHKQTLGLNRSLTEPKKRLRVLT
ncbi:hypothetical protein PM082_024988 [Marasmius tenuissimus]|nr:hypothetical protein PM082_024988 [Marasmius tenuissimus]